MDPALSITPFSAKILNVFPYFEYKTAFAFLPSKESSRQLRMFQLLHCPFLKRGKDSFCCTSPGAFFTNISMGLMPSC